MSITVSTQTRGGCSSMVRSHKADEPPRVSVLHVEVGNSCNDLCLECARDLFNALGFMITTKTGESIAQLVGLKKSPKAKVPR